MENILDIIYEYSKNQKIIDEKGLKRILEIYKEYENIYVIKNINIIRKEEILFNNVILGYCFDDFIDIYYSRIMVFIKEGVHRTNSILEDCISISDKYLRDNLYILFICFHEFEHAKQTQIALENNYLSLENRLLFLEKYYLDNMGFDVISSCKYDYEKDEYEMSIFRYLFYSLKNKIQHIRYLKNYDISFLERQADINANKKIIDMLSSIKEEIPQVYSLEEDILRLRKLRDYDICKISPTIDFFSNILCKSFYVDDDILNQPLDKRLELGLPITIKEYSDELKLIK